MPKNIITQTTNDFGVVVKPQSMLKIIKESGLALISSKLDNEMNEMVARILANSQEFFTRFLIQLLLVVILW